MFPGMIGRSLAAAFVWLLAFVSPANAQNVTNRAQAVVELYTSQGCSQCPRANRLIGTFADEDGVMALTFPVAIWDYLGWEDTFAQPEFTQRHRAYSRALRVRGRFTPQLVYNGASQMSASDWDDARAMLDQTRAAAPLANGPDIRITHPRAGRTRITIGSGAPRAEADVWLMAFDPGPVTIYVTDGVNRSRRIDHFNLVQWAERVGGWSGGAVFYERGRCTPQCAVIVQEPNGGRILSAVYTGPRPR
jgi:hypothetical protein